MAQTPNRAALVVPTLLGCRYATPSSEASRQQWKLSSHQPHNYAKHTACRIHKPKKKRINFKSKTRPNKGENDGKEGRKENKFEELISETKTGCVTLLGLVGRHRYMPAGRQEALIVSPGGVQVWPGTVCGVITPCSLVQHGYNIREGEERVK